MELLEEFNIFTLDRIIKKPNQTATTADKLLPDDTQRLVK